MARLPWRSFEGVNFLAANTVDGLQQQWLTWAVAESSMTTSNRWINAMWRAPALNCLYQGCTLTSSGQMTTVSWQIRLQISCVHTHSWMWTVIPQEWQSSVITITAAESYSCTAVEIWRRPYLHQNICGYIYLFLVSNGNVGKIYQSITVWTVWYEGILSVTVQYSPTFRTCVKTYFTWLQLCFTTV